MVINPIPKGLKKRYAKEFPARNLHHIIPRSRGGPSSQFNLFPYDKEKHLAYHDVFWNMRVDEVWLDLARIHHLIFDPNLNFIKTDWMAVCTLDIGDEKSRRKFYNAKIERLDKSVSVELLQEKWINCFGSDSIGTARKRLKEMLLYMVFGMNMLDNNILFHNGHLAEFLEVSPCTDERLWAFQVCFGDNCSIQAIKSKIARILK